MDTLVFIPRAVKKREPTNSTRKRTSPPTAQASVSSPPKASSDGQAHVQDQTRPNLEGAEQSTPNHERHISAPIKAPASQSQHQVDFWELAALVCLALSDYALWSDPDLRRKMDLNLFSSAMMDVRGDGIVDLDTSSTEGDATGYIPLTYLLEHSPVFRLSNALYRSYPLTLYVKALRTQASEVVDVRLVLSSGSGPSGRGRGTATALSGSGYEVRRKLELGLGSHFGKLDWERHTVYMENIPPAHRTIPGIIQLISKLLPDKTFKQLQNITFLPHRKDKPEDAPVCKGFALVTLASLNVVELLLKAWPWNRPTSYDAEQNDALHNQHPDSTLSIDEEAGLKLQNEARIYGLRMLSKESWEMKKAEYLLYRQQLIKEMNQIQDDERSMPLAHTSDNTKEAKERTSTLDDRTGFSSTPSNLNINDPYPYGCLVFVQNVHAETNKTALRSLFNQLCTMSDCLTRPDDGGSIDYVDYNKGMDTCFLRLKTPTQASYLVHQINSQNLYQQSGLDAEGSCGTNPTYIRAELIPGTREELYWNKVPEKVRRQAVERAVALSAHTPVATNVSQPRQDNDIWMIPPDAPYPVNCLVFVRNIHVGTNKTTLRALFANLSSSSSSQAPNADQENGIDYVDYSKGMDICYVRLCNPTYADRLVSTVNSSSIHQTSGLDASGETGTGPSITAQLITGKPEELYWGQLPEKVRQQAVEKLTSATRGNASGTSEGLQGSSQLKRKRKKGT